MQKREGNAMEKFGGNKHNKAQIQRDIVFDLNTKGQRRWAVQETAVYHTELE